MRDVPVRRQRLVIEGFGCSVNMDTNVFYSFFEDLTKALDMRILVPPMLVKVPIVNPAPQIDTEDYGWSGQLIWLESGSQIHAWPKHRFVAVDIFSCKNYTVEAAVSVFKKYFSPEGIDVCEPQTTVYL